jgi:hypothetical protein
MDSHREQLRREVADLLGDDGLLLFPGFTRTAPFHCESLLTPLDMVYTALWNVLGVFFAIFFAIFFLNKNTKKISKNIMKKLYSKIRKKFQRSPCSLARSVWTETVAPPVTSHCPSVSRFTFSMEKNSEILKKIKYKKHHLNL